MDRAGNSDFAEAIAGALDWWREAGVDAHFVDDPIAWLAPAQPAEDEGRPRRDGWPASPQARDAARPPEPAAPPAAPSPLTDLPADLTAFRTWWLDTPVVEAGGAGPRIAPQGVPDAPLMVLVDMPEDEDSDSLLSARQGRLLDAMLSAFGLSRAEIYLASVLPRHVAAPDWQALMAQGLGQVTLHHLALAAPRRIMVLGGHILPLIGHELPQRTAVLRELNHEGTTIPLLASWGLTALLQRPGGKAALWRTWLEWTAA
ncbi:hypothetical protein [Novosphingobium colocasiae]|uniref:DNA polymerase n=1 Tax=Novosphingobium colocasiae TaxID=1256513 RepID=A0A918PHS2_9SPHN|nr:hypothetical protein [Novosphingobium colocasiae]GGZ09025.1 DNA polymerase [Novosphingobium colocasiae]